MQQVVVGSYGCLRVGKIWRVWLHHVQTGLSMAVAGLYLHLPQTYPEFFRVPPAVPVWGERHSVAHSAPERVQKRMLQTRLRVRPLSHRKGSEELRHWEVLEGYAVVQSCLADTNELGEKQLAFVSQKRAKTLRPERRSAVEAWRTWKRALGASAFYLWFNFGFFFLDLYLLITIMSITSLGSWKKIASWQKSFKTPRK